MTSGRVGAIVLAGGRSRRFGRDKLAEPVDGRPLLDHAIARVLALGPETDVVVVTAPDAERSAPVPDGVRRASDAVAGEGPLAGLLAGLDALDEDVERVIVVGGDMPDLVPAVLALLLAACDEADAAVLGGGDRMEVLPMAVRRTPARRMARHLFDAGERRLRAVAAALTATTIAATAWRALDPDGATVHDIDAEGDLRRR